MAIAAIFWYDLIGTLILVVGVCSLVANFAILVIYKKMFNTKRLRLFNLNLISLTISDLGIVSMFPLKIDACFHRTWRPSMFMCELSSFLDGIFAYSQIFVLTEIALEKYFIIRSPKSYNPKGHVVFLKLLAVWLLAMLFSGFPYIGFGTTAFLDGIEISCSFNYHDQSTMNRLYVLCCVTCGFILPVMTIAFCYTGIFRIARTSLSKMKKGPVSQQREENQRRLEIKLAKTTAISIICFCISWAPYAVIALIGLFGSTPPPALAETIAAVLAKFSSTLNAVIYVFNHPRFKAVMLEGKKKAKEAEPSLNTVDVLEKDNKVVKSKV